MQMDNRYVHNLPIPGLWGKVGKIVSLWYGSRRMNSIFIRLESVCSLQLFGEGPRDFVASINSEIIKNGSERELVVILL